jgi:hypothetical protein
MQHKLNFTDARVGDRFFNAIVPEIKQIAGNCCKLQCQAIWRYREHVCKVFPGKFSHFTLVLAARIGT